MRKYRKTIENEICILLVINAFVISRVYKEFFIRLGTKKIYAAANVSDGMKKLLSVKPDVVVFDVFLSDNDGIDFYHRALNIAKHTRIKFIGLSTEQDEMVNRMLKDIGLEIIYPFPPDFEELCKSILKLGKRKYVKNADKYKTPENLELIEEKTKELFYELGVPENYKGYNYLKACIKMAFFDITCIKALKKKLYTPLAGLYKTSPKNVEKSILRVIDNVCLKGNRKSLQLLFQRDLYMEKTTNSEFISIVTDRLRMENSFIYKT